MINSNRLVGIFFLILGLFVFLAIPYQIAEGNTQYGPRLFPKFVSLLMIVCSLGLLYQEFKGYRAKKITTKKPEQTKTAGVSLFQPGEFLKAVIMFAIMTAYIFIIDMIGFLPSSLLFGTTALIFYRIKKWYYYIIVLGLTVVIYLLFSFLLMVQLP